MKTEPEATEALKSVAAAVTGNGSPESAAVVTGPPAWTVRMLSLAGPALSVMIGWVIAILGGGLVIFGMTLVRAVSWPEAVAGARVQGLTWIGLALCAILAVVVFRLASGGLKRIEAKAGPAEMKVSTED